MVAVVGPTGSGKSTLGTLLCRLYEPPRGTVFVGGHDVLDLPLGRLRRSIGYVPQEAFLFSRSAPRQRARSADESARPERLERGGRGPPGWRDDRGAAPRAGTRWSASAGSRCRAASASGWRWRARSWPIRRSSCSTTCFASVDAAKECGDPPRAPGRAAAGRTTLVMTHRLRVAAGGGRDRGARRGARGRAGHATSISSRPAASTPASGASSRSRTSWPMREERASGRARRPRTRPTTRGSWRAALGGVDAPAPPARASCSRPARSSRRSPRSSCLQPYLIKIAIDRPHPRGRLGGPRPRRGGSSCWPARPLRAAGRAGLPDAAHRPAGHARPARGALRASPAAGRGASSTGARSGRLMTRVLNDVEAINELFTSGVVAVVGDVVDAHRGRRDHARA